MELRSQRWAQRAYDAVQARRKQPEKEREKYLSFARAFPTLLHTCGLAQATAYAAAKKEQHAEVLADLAGVLDCAGANQEARCDQLLADARTKPVIEYLRLSREALAAAGWLKRYAEALLEKNAAASGAGAHASHS